MPATTHPTHQTVRLARGRHRDARSGACVMELVSMLAGETFGDRPLTACPVIASFLRAYNDGCRSKRRQDLYGLASLAVGTRAGREVEQARLRRCVEVATEEHRGLRLRRLRTGPPVPGAETLDRMSWRVARILRARGDDGHARALELVEELAAIGPGTDAVDVRGSGRSPSSAAA